MKHQFEFHHADLLNVCPPWVAVPDWEDYRQRMHEATHQRSDRPIQLDLELTTTCNLKCPFCLQGHQTRKKQELSIEQAKRVLDEARALGVVCVKLNNWNEPLLSRTVLPQIIEYASKIGMINIYFATNGILLDRWWRTTLLDLPVTRIFVSIDAASPETYAIQRQTAPGVYTRIVSNVKALLAERVGQFPLVRVSFLKTRANLPEAAEFLELWDGVADIVTFQTMNEVPGVSTGLTVETFAEAAACDFPFKMLVVGADKIVLPCCKLHGRELVLGHIDTISLAKAWDSAEWLRELHQTGQWKNFQPCRRCLLGGS